MLINGIDTNAFAARLIDRSVSTVAIDSLYDWLKDAVEGTLLLQSYNFKTIKLTFLIDTDNEEDAYKNISALTRELKKCSLYFDDINLDFPCFLVQSATPIRIKNGKFKIEYLLKNDWAKGESVTKDFDVAIINCKPITIKYVLDWTDTLGYYLSCFNEDEIRQTIGEETIWIATDTLSSRVAASSSWDSLFANLGVDLQKYYPATRNTQAGKVNIRDIYAPSTALVKLQTESEFAVIYRRFSKDGYYDLPDSYYPSMVQTTDSENSFYVDLGVGAGWNVRDISIVATGRYFQNKTNGNGSIVGAGFGNSYFLGLSNPDALINVNTTPDTGTKRYKVFNTDTSSSGGITFVTLESISALPLRKYGIRSSIDSSAPLNGYVDFIFNGTTLDRAPLKSFELSNNLTIFAGGGGTAAYCDICRVQVRYKNKLVLDAIPIAGSLKNGFINNYDTAWYDMVNMKFIPWVHAVGSIECARPQALIPLSGARPQEVNNE